MKAITAMILGIGGLGLVPGLGQSCIPVAFITFIAMLFLGTAVVG